MNPRRISLLISLAALLAGAEASYGTPGRAPNSAAMSPAAGIEVPDSPVALEALEQHRARFGSRLLSRSAVTSIVRTGDWLTPQAAGAQEEVLGGAMHLALPVQADRPFHLGDEISGLSVEVTPIGLAPVPAEVADGYVVYRGAHAGGGDVLQRPFPTGMEDYVILIAPPEKAEFSYSIALGAAVAGLRLVASTLELLDGSGAPRLRLSPPFIVDGDGTRHAATITVADCAFDSDPRPPWERQVTAPGARTCTVGISWAAEGITYPAILDPSWTLVRNNMSVSRVEHTAVLLDPALDSRHIARVLIAGGRTSLGRTSTADIYDPQLDQFTATASMGCAREKHTATLLLDGRVLVVGGLTSGDGLPGGDPDAACPAAELYDPDTGTWSAVALGTAPPVWGHAASRIEGGAHRGKVLVTGGRVGPTSKPTSATHLFNPATNTFQKVPSMPASRYGHGQASQPDGGLVVVADGSCPDCTSLNTTFEVDTNVSDPTKIKWRSVGSVGSRLQGSVVLTVTGNKVIIAGGGNSGIATDDSLLHVFGAQAWVEESDMTTARREHRGALLSDGRVIVAGGRDVSGQILNSAEIWDPDTNTWGADPAVIVPMHAARALHTVTGMQAGKVLAAGGIDETGAPRNDAEVFPIVAAGPPACDPACSPGFECTGNGCIPAPCSPGFADCNGDVADGCETDLTRPDNCGACGNSCDDGNSCTFDSCASGQCRHVDQRTCLAPPTSGEGGADCTTMPLPAGCWGDACGGDVSPLIQALLPPGCQQTESDGDGLPDSWELSHAVDGNCDGDFDDLGPGGPDLLLPDDPDWDEVAQPNAYVTYDWMAKDPLNPTEAAHEPQPDFDGYDSLGNPVGTVNGTLTRVIEAFARQGIRLKIVPNTRTDPATNTEVPTSPLPHQEVVTFVDPPGECATNSGANTAVSFYELKRQNFEPRRKFVYKYAVFAHRNQCSGNCSSQACLAEATDLGLCGEVEEDTTGLAEVFGNDLVVTLGGLALEDGSSAPEPLRTAQRDRAVRHQAGTLMHEIGHLFGLEHGGPHDPLATCSDPGQSAINRKPNLISSMNYAHQVNGIRHAETNCSTMPALPDPPYAQLAGAEGDWRVDYSSGVERDLDEGALDERDGISPCVCGLTDGLRDISIAFRDCDPVLLPIPGCGPVDWNRVDGASGIVGVDINQDSLDQSGAICPTREPLEGFDEWSFVRGHLAFQCNANFQEGSVPIGLVTTVGGELNYESAKKLDLRSPGLVGVVVQPGQPPVIPLGGTFQVAILGSDSLDVTSIDPPTLRFAGAAPADHVTNNVNGDPFDDLVARFNTSDTSLTLSSTQATLTGSLQSGVSIEGHAVFTVTQATTCDAGFADCDGSPSNGCETDITTISNCGACGLTCPTPANASPACADGFCLFACHSGFGDCNGDVADGCENDLTAIPNCGACGLTCDDGSACTHDICSGSVCGHVDRSTCANLDVSQCATGGCGACNFADVFPGCTNPDTDQDGLGDAWEDAGAIDLDCDGDYDANDVVIPGANKYVADIYVKASAMESSVDRNSNCLIAVCPQGYGCDPFGFCRTEPANSHLPTQEAVSRAVAMFGGSHLNTTPVRCDGGTPCAAGFACSTEDFVCLPTCTTDGDCAAGTDGGRCVDGLCRRRRLHFRHDEINTLPHTEVITYGPVSPVCITGGDTTQGVDFLDLKADPANFDPRTALFTHYGVFGHFNSCDSSGTCANAGCTLDMSDPGFGTIGFAEIGGNDFVVTLGGFPATSALEKDRRDSGAFTHELGHNLGLRHGGPDCQALQPGESCDYAPDQDNKINHVSVMNSMYRFGIPTTATPGTTTPGSEVALDYSHGVLGTLVESSLYEPDGVSPGFPPPFNRYLVRYLALVCDYSSCVLRTMFGSTNPGTSIDWDASGSIESFFQSLDINHNGLLEEMSGVEEWSHLHYAFQCGWTIQN